MFQHKLHQSSKNDSRVGRNVVAIVISYSAMILLMLLACGSDIKLKMFLPTKIVTILKGSSSKKK